MNLNKALDLIKGGPEGFDDDKDDLLDSFTDQKELLEESILELNPKCERHVEMDQHWLYEKIQSVKQLFEDCQTKCQRPLKKLLGTAGEAAKPQKVKNSPQQKNSNNKNKKNNKSNNKKKSTWR